jgi:ligand-binding sensor domain-containing protein
LNRFFENIFRIFTSTFLVFCFQLGSMAQEPIAAPHFKFLNHPQGFHGDKVRAMIQDTRGFIWIGTNEGVFIFNGESFEQVKAQDPKANEIVGSIIQKMAMDSEGNVWIGSNKGLVVYMNQKQAFTYIPLQHAKHYITGIVETPDHNIWVSSDLGIYNIQVQNLVASQQFTTQSIPSMSHVVLCNQKLYIVSVQNIYTIDYKTRHIKSIHTYNLKPITSENISTSVISDQKNSLWIGKYNGMIYSFNCTDRTIDSVDTKKETSNNSAIINQLYYQSQDSSLIACIDESGVYEYKHHRLTSYFNSYQSLPTKKITGILIDNENNTWISMEKNGLAISNPSLNFFSNYNVPATVKSTIISAIFKDSKNNLWIGTDGGGLLLKNKNEHVFLHHTKNKNSISNDAILSITEDKKGNIWIGSFRGGLSLYNPINKSFTNYTMANSAIAGNDVRKITEDANGNLWLVIHGKGISCFNPSTKTFKNYTASNSLWTYDLIIDKENNKWIASNEGVTILNEYQELKQIPSTQLGLDIHTLCEDEKNNIWIGTVKGLYYLKKKQWILKQIPKKSLLNQLSITWIKQIKKGYLLIGTSKGLFLLNTQTYETQFYNRDNGLPSDELVVNSVYKADNTKIYVGTSNGYFTFNYDALPIYVLNKKPIIQYLYINDQPQSIEQNLTLPYNQNNLTLQIAYPYYSINRTDVVYEYKIEELDKEWKVSNNAQLNFRSLPYGKYNIKIRCINKSNRSQHSPEAILQIYIQPPIWETIWFKSLAILLLIIGIYIYYNLKTKRIIEQNKILESKIEERTSLLNRQKELLLVKQAELEASNQSKEKLFSIIAHDLRAPFSSILGLTQLLKDRFNKIEASEYMRYLDVMQNSSEDAFQLLDNLLEWAKTHMHSITYNPDWHSLHSLTLDVIKNFNNRALEKNI